MTTKKTSTKKATAEDRDERPKELDAPEPKDKTSDAWRYWTLRHIEAGLVSQPGGKRAEAWGAFWRFFDTFRDTLLSRRDYTAADVYDASALLPHLVIA